MRVPNLRSFVRKALKAAIPAVVAALVLAPALPARAQGVTVPNFWDPGENLVRPDLSSLQRLRFLTTTDFPPFNFIDRSKRLSGFHVDLARAICAELDILPKCQIQALPWTELEDAMARGDGDAIIAGLEVSADTRKRFEFSRPYLRIPARFIARKADGYGEPIGDVVLRHKVGLVAGSQHLIWFDTVFTRGQREVFPTRQAALDALRAGSIDLVFSDAVSLSFWLLSDASGDCCVFAGGPYLPSGDFSQGLAIAFPKGRTELSAAADYALKAISEKGVFAELYLRYFPLGLY
ncbi:MAG: transporter substrate-binding domain-containing protein [Nitratireductor sp.]|nr:transporter substrate-binding domain-containing protein [Nitratireductor sp.]